MKLMRLEQILNEDTRRMLRAMEQTDKYVSQAIRDNVETRKHMEKVTVSIQERLAMSNGPTDCENPQSLALPAPADQQVARQTGGFTFVTGDKNISQAKK